MERNTARIVGVIVTVALVALLTVIAYGPIFQNHSQPLPSDANTPMMSVEQLGSVGTLSQARTAIGLDFTPPSSSLLPTSLSSAQIRASAKSVALIYNSSALPRVLSYNEGSLIIIMIKDGTTYYFPQPQTESITTLLASGTTTRTTTLTATLTPQSTQAIINVTISGNLGWGFQNGGRLEWWTNGVHCIILGGLPLTTLTQIADSLQISS